MRTKKLGAEKHHKSPSLLPRQVQATSHEMFLAHVTRLRLGYCESVPHSRFWVNTADLDFYKTQV